jgi:II/X family phage/plasmid replication protein
MIARPFSPVFIDWTTVQQLHPEGGIKPVNNGKVFSVDEDGLIEWEVERPFSFEGSHESRVQIQSDGWTVKLSGNVGRFHRRDNIFGFTLDEVMGKANRILASFDLPPFTKGKPFLEYGSPFSKFTGAFFTRLDLTENFSVGSAANVAPFMQHLAAQSVSRMRTGSFPDGYTVDYGRGSKYWYAKAYAKHHQLTARQQKKHPPVPDVLAFVEHVGMVRFEVTLKSRFLSQNGLRYWGAIDMQKLNRIFYEKAEVIRREKAAYESLDQMFEDLPAELLGTALAWKMGKDLSCKMKRATYYRHRRKLLIEHGIDISQPCKVVELATRIKVREIEVMPMVAPDWYWDRTGTGI